VTGRRSLALALVAATSAGAAPGYQLYPVRGVFFPPDESQGRIDPAFRAAILGGEQGAFAAAFRHRFPEAATTITEKNQRRTFAVSLQVARASRYRVAKLNGNVDLHFPVTASLYFSNVMTGEVLYAATRTSIKTATLTAAEAAAGDEKTAALFLETFRAVVEDLVGDARQHFQPRTVAAKVIKAWNGLAILGGGTEVGLQRDDALTDELGNELQVVHAGRGSAVASVALGKFAVGATFSKVSSGTLAEISKPRLLPVVEAAPAGFPEEALVQLFSDALGASAPVSLVPVNRTFAAVVQALGAQVELSKERLTQRELPGFFVRLHVPEPVSYERATNLDYTTVRVTEALAFAEVVDRSGRVLFAAHGQDHIEDEITRGQALGLEARQEIAVKNALLALAKRFGADFKLETTRLALAEGAPAPKVKDEHGVLTQGATVRAFRSLGRVDGATGEVLVPTWELEVAVPGEAVTELAAVLPLVRGAPALEAGDVLLVEGASAGDARRKRFGPCGEADQLGPVAIPGYAPLAFNLFAQGYRAPFYARGLGPRVMALVHGGTGFKEDLTFAEPKVDSCIQPAYRIATVEPRCSERSCAEVATIAVGFRARLGGADGEVRGNSGQQTRMTATALPRGTSPEVKAQALLADLYDEVLKLAPAAAAGLAREKL
jgi:hypothetical protein